MAHGDAREGKWRGNIRVQWVASSFALDDGARSIQLLSADPHSSSASSRLNWHPRRFKWTRPFRWKTKSGFCACAITFRTCSTKGTGYPLHSPVSLHFPPPVRHRVPTHFNWTLPAFAIFPYAVLEHYLRINKPHGGKTCHLLNIFSEVPH